MSSRFILLLSDLCYHAACGRLIAFDFCAYTNSVLDCVQNAITDNSKTCDTAIITNACKGAINDGLIELNFSVA